MESNTKDNSVAEDESTITNNLCFGRYNANNTYCDKCEIAVECYNFVNGSPTE